MRPTDRLTARLPRSLTTMATNSGWLLVSTAVRMGVGFVTAVWLTRYLGPESFGLYSYVIAFVMIFAGVSAVGMLSLVTRELVETPDEQDRILGSALVIRLGGAAAAMVALIVLSFALHPDLDRRMALIVFGVVLVVQPFDVVSLFYEAKTQSRYVVWIQVAVATVYVGTVALFIYLELSVVWFLIARLGEAILIQIGVLTIFTRQGHRPTRWTFERGRARKLLGEAWPLVFSALGAVLYLRIDQVMLGLMTTSREVGIYAAAARLSEVWYFIPVLIVASAFPYLLRLRAADRTSYSLRLQQLYDVLAWLGLTVAIVVTILAPWLIPFLFGDEFAGSSPILQVHVWAAVFIFMRAAFSKWLIAERLLTYSLITQGAGALVNIAVNLVLIPLWGGMGAAWATLISYAVASYLALLLFPSTRPAATMMTKAMAAPLRYLRMSSLSGG